MNKTELVRYVIDNVDSLPKVLAEKVVNTVFEAITAGLEKDGEVVIIGHGSYSVTTRAERDGRHPKTGEIMRIPSVKGVKFKTGKYLKDAINKK